MPQVDCPHKGIETWVNPHGIRIVRLHYLADPEKDAAWAEKEKAGMTDPARYRQEYEIDFQATAGQLVYILHEEATLCQSFPIPENWTRYMALDPHPRVPHAMLWCAVAPDGTHYYYRELWGSKICGLPGNPPDDDNRHTIPEAVETIKWLESKANVIQCSDGKTENGEHDERIYKRVIDYSARAMGQGTTDDPEQPNFQQRYENAGHALHIDMTFEDAKKDLGVGIETVNLGLKPLPALDASGNSFVNKSKIQIFQDKCPELVWELRNNRWKPLTPTQQETHDPSGQVIDKRKHMTDCLRYIEMAGPEFIAPPRKGGGWKPISPGVNY